jgi:hypothetical protein
LQGGGSRKGWIGRGEWTKRKDLPRLNVGTCITRATQIERELLPRRVLLAPHAQPATGGQQVIAIMGVVRCSIMICAKDLVVLVVVVIVVIVVVVIIIFGAKAQLAPEPVSGDLQP